MARSFGRYGYKRITGLLQMAGWNVNAKRVQRIWRAEGLKVPSKQPKRGHFPTRPEWQTPHWPLPSPHSEEFWRSYGEPLAFVVDAAAQLSWILLAFQMHSPEHVRPTAGQRLRLDAALDSLGALTLNAWPRAHLDDRGRPQVRCTRLAFTLQPAICRRPVMRLYP